MPRNTLLTNVNEAAAAEFALRAHAFCDPAVATQVSDSETIRRQLSEAVDLTEAPEDAVCSLIIDLMYYCDREGIDWDQDVLQRAIEQHHLELVGGGATA
jgi:hypothetical protein